MDSGIWYDPHSLSPARGVGVNLFPLLYGNLLMAETELIPIWLLLAAGVAFFVPWGLAFVVAGGQPSAAARRTALLPILAFALALLGYATVGFALHYGGIGLLIDHPDLNALVWEWSPLSAEWGATWGAAGAAGFGLDGARTPVAMLLLLSTLPWAATAALLPMLALAGRAPRLVGGLFGALTAGLGYPLLGNWTQGGGWLATLGFNIGAGHGFVDFGGAGLFLFGGGVTLAALLSFLRRLPPADASSLPPAPHPLLAAFGAALVIVGASGWLTAWPLHDWTQVAASTLLLQALLAAAGGALAPILYTWLVAGAPDPLQAARGIVAGWVAGLALAPFAPPLLLAAVGGGAGLLLVLATYLIDHRLRLDDPGGLLAMTLLPALWGLLAVGLFADGRTGAGFNRIGRADYLGVAGQGVTGLYPAAGFVADPGQWQAQAIAAAVIFLLGFLATTLLAAPLALIVRAWGRAERPAPADEA